MFTIASILALSFSAQLIAPPQDPGIRPQILPRERVERALQLDQLKIHIQIADGTAATEIEQVFLNRTNRPAEEVYLWPIPEGASVTDFQLWIDGKAQKAEILDKEKARGVYEEIVRGQRDPALLEWAGLGCVRCSVFPVPGNGEGRVKLKYIHNMTPSAGLFEYELPLRLAAIAPSGIRSLTIDGAIESQRPLSSIYSPTHSLDVKKSGDRSARFSYEGSGVSREKDFLLTYLIANQDFGALILAHRSPGADGFFSLALSPRFDLAPAAIQPKDIIFVCDTSGSMQGVKIEQARKALTQCLGRLNANDRFAVVRFSTEAESFKSELLDATKENTEAAKAWVSKFEARGGTNIDDALTNALKYKKNEGRLAMIFFLTDGCPTIGVTDPVQLVNRVKANNTNGLRLFTFGVGFDVNTQLLDTLARETKAAREYVRPEEDVEHKVSALFDKVESPVLSNISISVSGAEFNEVYPKEISDLFKGSQLLLTGRYRGKGPAILKLSGKINNESREFTFNINLPEVEERYDSIAPLWATRKVGFLMDEIRLRGANAELVAEIKRLAREYNIITPYTSFLVVEEGRRVASARGGVDRFALAAGDEATTLLVSDSKESLKRLEELSLKKDGEIGVNESQDAGGLAGATGNEHAPPASTRPAGLSGPFSGGGAPGGRTELSLRRLRDGENKESAEDVARRYSKSVGTRVFQMIDKVWVDTSFTENDRAKIVKIKFLSDEYFSLVKKEPGLAACFALGERVVVQCKGTFYEVES
ncbi:MAG: VWA domain-containing protein [Planctomycetes bacterium]|nr:VWA domain-containing protein [Planctomycetota bacterium]